MVGARLKTYLSIVVENSILDWVVVGVVEVEVVVVVEKIFGIVNKFSKFLKSPNCMQSPLNKKIISCSLI